MRKHLLCVTVDTDPDGLSGKVTNRQTLSWQGLESLRNLPEELARRTEQQIPITWFVRADGQLESALGSSAYLLEKYEDFWSARKAAGDELGWHPHLYRQGKDHDVALIVDPRETQDELERLWGDLKSGFHPTAFRNGEGWHTPETYTTVEGMGFLCDSTAIPGRRGAAGHPMNWEGAPNQPYFPSRNNLCECGPERSMLELPMNTWRLHAPHDQTPRLRYMNPAVHPHLFATALRNWENECTVLPADILIWVMIFHPDEVLSSFGDDGLYSRSTQSLCANLLSFSESVLRLGDDFDWVCLSSAAERWKQHQQRLVA